MSEVESGEGWDEQDPICLSSQKPNVRNGVHHGGDRLICCQSGKLVHEQPQQWSLGYDQVDIPILERHLKYMPTIRLQ